MKKAFLFASSLFFLSASFAQTGFSWAKSMGNSTNLDQSVAIKADAMGNVYTAGRFSGTVDFDPGAGVVNLTSGGLGSGIFIQKLDPAGNLVWAKCIDGTGGYTYVYSMNIDANDNIYIGGAYTGTIDMDPNAAVVSFSSTVVAGFISKFDASGNYLWTAQEGNTGTTSDGVADIDFDNQGNVYAVGYFGAANTDFDPGAGTFTLSTNGNRDIFLWALNSAGNFLWAKGFGGPGQDFGKKIGITSTNQIVIASRFNSTLDADPGAGIVSYTSLGNSDNLISAFSNTGNYLWSDQIGNTNDDGLYALTIDNADNILFSGTHVDVLDVDPSASVFTVTGSPSYNSSYLVKLNSSGIFTWADGFISTSTNNSTITGIAIDLNNDYCLTGAFSGTVDFDPSNSVYYQSSNTSSNVFVLKLLNTGALSDVISFGGLGYDVGTAIAIKNFSIFTCGTFDQAGDFDQTVGIVTLNTNGNTDCFVHKMGFCSTISTSTTVSSCGSYISPSGNHTWTTSGTYLDTVRSVLGCDSIITFNLTVITPAVPTVVISTTDSTICQGDNVIFTTTITNGGSTPNIDWFRNGSYFTNGATFSSTSLNNNDQIKAVLTSSLGCVTTQYDTSSIITMTVGNPGGSASIYINTALPNVCSEDTVLFTASGFDTGNNPVYQWTLNSVSIGGNSTTLSIPHMINGEVVACTLVSSDVCLTNNTATSSAITMVVNPSEHPSIVINGTGSICVGETANFTTTAVDAGSSPIINWYLNSNLTPIATGATFSSNTLSNGDTIKCVLVNNDPCAVPNYDISNEIIMSIATNPTPTIMVNTSSSTICAGTSVTFTSVVAFPGASPQYQWYINNVAVAGETNSTFTTSSLTNGNTVSCLLVSSLVCATQDSVYSGQTTINVNSPSSSSQTLTLCNGQSVTVGSNTYNSTGTYTDVLINALGCDSIITTNLIVQPAINVAASLNAGTMAAAQTGASYQWINCSNNLAIVGATNQTFTPTANGNYAVIVTQNSCSDTSACLNINDVGMGEVTLKGFVLSPNPATDQLIISGNSDIIFVRLYDILGNLIYQSSAAGNKTFTLSVSNLTDGFYFIDIETEIGHSKETFIKQQ